MQHTLCVIKASAQLAKEGPCRNFAYYSILIIPPWRPKGGDMEDHKSDQQFLSNLNQITSFIEYSLYYAEACSELEGSSPRHCACGQQSSFGRNDAAVASRWQHCVRFDWFEISTSNLPLKRKTRYHSTKWPFLSIHKTWRLMKRPR